MKLTPKEITRVALFSSLISLSSLILKFGGDILVPFSILPLMVMLAGAVLGSRMGALSVAVYVLIGLAGAPVFAKPPFGGIVYVLQPTFGFIPMAYVIGKLLEVNNSRHFLRFVGAMAVGTLVMYLVGIPYLYGIVKIYFGKPFSLWNALQIGMLPFIGLDMLKAVIAGFVAKTILDRLDQQGSIK